MPSIFREFITDFIAGGAGGTACVYCGQPLDTIKVKMQTFPKLYKGSFDCFRQTLAKEGVRGLYKGSAPALLCNVSENVVLFVALGGAKKLIGNLTSTDPQKLSNFQSACAGSIASIFSSLVVCPTELIKCKMQALAELKESGKLQSNVATGPYSIARDMLKTGGFRSLYGGLTSTWAREMPGYFVFFYGYELTRSLLTPAGKTKEDLGQLATAFAGGTAGLCLWTLVFPIDVVKTRIQVLTASGHRSGFISTLRMIVATEGFGALYSGLLPSVVRTYPANGALFVAYEYTKKLLKGDNED